MTNTDKPYEQWRFETSDAAVQEILTALLEDCGFEGFEQRADALVAAAPMGTVDADAVQVIAAKWNVRAIAETVEPQNWNARWEADYKPVVVPGWCTVRAHFHLPATDTPHEVVITPKMSFGTGHHATTWLMLDAMRGIDFRGKTVLDFGTGTGVLAILAGKLGATRVLAIDNDAWSVENAVENAELNGLGKKMEVQAGSLEAARGATFDVILANINRHVLLEHMREMRSILAPTGTAFISGLLEEDESVIIALARATGFLPQPARHRNGWIALRLD